MKLAPATRRLIVWSLAFIAFVAVVANVWLTLADKEASEALLTLAAGAVGGISGMAVPHTNEPDPPVVLEERVPSIAHPLAPPHPEGPYSWDDDESVDLSDEGNEDS